MFMGHGGFESYNISMSITCKYVIVTSLKHSSKLGHSKKDSYPTHRGNFHRPEKAGGGGSDCLKNILNLYKMSGEGQGKGVLLISSMGGMGLFWNNLFKFNVEFTISKYHQYKQ